MPLIVYCIAALTSLSDNLSYVILLFSEWRVEGDNLSPYAKFGELAFKTFQDNSRVPRFTLEWLHCVE